MTSDLSRFDAAGGTALWQSVLTGYPPDILAPGIKSAFQRFSSVVGARYALHLLGNPQGLLPVAQLDEERSWARLQFFQTDQFLRDLSGAGFDFLLLKGQALARVLYPDPSLRLSEDVDLLVREDQLPALLQWLQDKGFVLQALPARPWGFMSDSSFWPLMSPDRRIALDLHLQADAWPFHRGLPAQEIFAQAQCLPESGLCVPCREHLLLLLISNAAKVKFGPNAWRRACDLALLLRAPGAID